MPLTHTVPSALMLLGGIHSESPLHLAPGCPRGIGPLLGFPPPPGGPPPPPGNAPKN